MATIFDMETQRGSMRDRMFNVPGRTGMRRWKVCSILILALGFGVLGCGGGATSTVSVTISPTAASVITNTTQTFTPFVSGTTDMVVTWTVTCPTGVTAPACGTIDTNGVYTAPKVIPTVTSNGTTVITPTATITATAHAASTKTASATVTIISGISISINPTTATVGTRETFTFAATVSNPGCDNTVPSNNCQVVTWSLSTTLTGIGSIDPNLGVYTAPGTVPTTGSAVTITATSVKDTSVTATASVTVVTAAPPTVTSVSPNVAALGSLFQDVYITGTNFISTNKVFINGNLINGVTPIDSLPNVSIDSSSVIRARIPDTLLATPPPSGILTVTVSQQTGTPQNCSPDPAQCQVVVGAVRPVIVGPSPNNIQQCNPCSLSFGINGGFFGTVGNPTVSATFRGVGNLPIIVTNARQMSVTLGGGGTNANNFLVPGLYPVAIQSVADATKFDVTNIAVQPNYAPNASSGSTISNLVPPVILPAGSSPSDVAINPATGLAIIANTGTDSVSFIDLTASSPVLGATICTAAVGAVPPPCPTPSGPKSVAVDYALNIALVVNTTSQTIAVVDLNNKIVTSVTQPLQDIPAGVGINPCANPNPNVSTCQGRALVTMQNKPYGLLLDLTQTPPAILGPVTISTGANSRVAVDPQLNWAIATPGGIGSIGIVDLNQQSVNTITSLSRTTTNNINSQVTVTVQPSTAAAPQEPLAVQLNDTVLIQGVTADPSFNGFYTVTGLGPGNGQFVYTQTGALLPDKTITNAMGTVNYAAPVATLALTTTVQGIGINPETHQTVMVDPSPNGTSNGVVSFFSLLDQSVSSLTLRTVNGTTVGPVETGNVAGAFNPLTNVAVTVNPRFNTLSVIDPSTPVRLNNTVPFATRPDPVAVAVDPGTNLAVVVNQTDNSVSIVSLGATIQPLAITETYPKQFVVHSTLQSVAPPSAVTLTVIGKGLAGNPLSCTNGATSAKVRLDGIPLTTSCIGTGDRELAAIVPPSMLTSARRYALDVLSPDGTTVSNATDFTVVQSVDVSTGCSMPPLPAGVAIDPTLGTAGVAAVSLSGCNTLALIDLASGTGQTVVVGTNPFGVAVLPRLHKAVVANNVSNNASVVDEIKASVTSTVSTGTAPMGVAADQDTGTAAVANSVSNTASIVTLATGGAVSIPTGQRPVAVAFDYQTNQIAAAADASNSVGIANASSNALTTSFPISVPTSVAYDPWGNDFLAASSTNNSITIYDPTTQSEVGSLRVGINPTAIAFNTLTGTLISTNTGSHTITVADILGNQIRAVLTLPPAPVNSTVTLSGALQFPLDIHPLTNLAVIADTANGRVLLVPVPR
jgi:DNA-binding beta-propeller fold protein YncE